MKITDKAIDNPIPVFIISLLIIMAGIYSFNKLSIERFPETNNPILMVSINFNGATPKQIENLVTNKVENELKKIEDVEEVWSEMGYGYNHTWVKFKENSNFSDRKNDFTYLINSIDLPKESEKPEIYIWNDNQGPLVNVVLYGKEYDNIKLKKIASDTTLLLKKSYGVETIELYGGLDKEIIVELNPLKLLSKGITINDILTFFNGNNISETNGNINIEDKELPVKFKSTFFDQSDIGKSIIKYSDNIPILVEDISKIYDSSSSSRTASRLNGINSVTLSVSKQPNKNTLQTIKSLKEILLKSEKNGTIPSDLKWIMNLDTSKTINNTLDGFIQPFIFGILSIILVLVISTGIRNSIFSLLSIFFSMLSTSIVMLLIGVPINNFTLFTLIIFGGIALDGSITIITNIKKSIQDGKDKIISSKEGVIETWKHILSSVLPVILLLLPLLFLCGKTGKIFYQIPVIALIIILLLYLS